MKSLFSAVVLSLVLATSAFAHCGKCGMDGDHKAGDAAKSGAQCPMHDKKMTLLSDAAAALETSKPELAAQLKELAAKCCGDHSKA